MRPAQQISAPDVWMVREQASFNFEALLLRASEPGPSYGNRFAEANPIRSFFFTPAGERYIYVN